MPAAVRSKPFCFMAANELCFRACRHPPARGAYPLIPLAAAMWRGTDLIALGSRAGNAHDVVAHAPCPVHTVRG
jgi:hypothetical protein